MQDMLTDVFVMHDVCVEVGWPEVGVNAEAESESVDVAVDDSNRVPNKLEELLKDADTPLHGNTKHSKLGAIVRLYSIKCMSGWSNTSFSMLLEFINELMPPDTSLPKDTYEAKKYLKDLQFASLDVHEATVFYVKLDYPWSECTRTEYRCISSTPCK